MKLEEILKANICAFGQTIFDLFSLEEDEFSRALDYYITNNNYKEIIDEYAYQLEYDLEDVTNISNKYNLKNEKFDYTEIINCSTKAFIATITKDKTINVEALIDNIIKELNK